MNAYRLFIKRGLDIACSLLVFIFLGWLLLLIAILVRLKLGSPVFFTQERTGMMKPDGTIRVFRLYKFRSMTDARDSGGQLLPDKERLTRFGKWIRATSLDELPEFWNILKGDMSLVGPRPWLVKYVEYYSDFDRKRHQVRPGLTGLAQISGRNSLSWKNKFRLDAEYAENVCFWLDLKILFGTVKKVFKREGIEFEEGHQSIMDYFAGEKSES